MRGRMHLAIITTCTNKKRPFVPDPCRLENCLQGNLSATVNKWLLNIQNPAQKRFLPDQLYVGSHWRESQKCVGLAKQKGLDASLWVLSAGWGFIPSDFPIAPYAATFSAGQDSVQSIPWPKEYSTKERCRRWWNAINEGRKQKGLCRVTDLPEFFGKTNEDLRLLVITSREYYLALESELLALIGRGVEVIIVCAGLSRDNAATSPIVRDYLLPFSDKFKQAHPSLNKTNVSLNARLAVWLLTKHFDDLCKGHRALLHRISTIESRLSEPDRRDVVKMTDAEVLKFIGVHHGPEATATKLLRKLRDVAGKSCEQKRFGALFKQYVRTNVPKGLFQ